VTLDVARELPRFERPVLIAWTPEDRSFPLRLGERLAAAFPDARLVTIPDSRVFVAEDAPDACADAIAAFVTGATEPRPRSAEQPAG
jgi:pimeloyl-ACP methyl ester carboxylesterase